MCTHVCIAFQEHNTIKDFPGAEKTDQNLLVADCDILVPAAGEKQITAEIAHNVKAKVVIYIVEVVMYSRVYQTVCIRTHI